MALRPMPSSTVSGSQATTSTRRHLPAERPRACARIDAGFHAVRVDERTRTARHAAAGARQAALVDLEQGDRARRVPAGRRVDEHEHVVAVEQLVGEVHAADAVVGDLDAVGAGSAGQLPHDLDAEPVVAAGRCCRRPRPASGSSLGLRRRPPSTGSTSSGAKYRYRPCQRWISASSASSSGVTPEVLLAVDVEEDGLDRRRAAAQEQVLGVRVPRAPGAAVTRDPRATRTPSITIASVVRRHGRVRAGIPPRRVRGHQCLG